MRRRILIWVVAVAGAGWAAGIAAPAPEAAGLLTGETQISFGCPGPVREGVPGCNPWHPLRRARFAVAPSDGDTPLVVVSTASGRFSVSLPAGHYVVTPLAQPAQHTNGGKRLIVQVRAGRTTRILVRFEGYPRML